jgi:hypothetical protein
MRMRTSLLGAAVLLAGACSGQEEKPYTVLPPSEVRHVFPWVDGQSAKVDRGWMPEKADVDLLESHLGEIAKLKPRCCVPKIADARGFYRQYIGIVVGGRRQIYVNAFAPDPIPKDWQSRLTFVYDGGGGYWRVLFDPVTGQFSDLETNGFA